MTTWDPVVALEAERRRTQERLRRLAGDYAGIVEASADSNADDEHDPEGATIAFERSQVDALVQQPLGEVGMITGTLSADPHILPAGLAGRDCGADQGLDGGVALVEGRGHQS